MTLQSGAKMGRYEIRSRLGAGGMGEVYRARDEKLNRDVAIKVLPATLSENADRLHRFELEAQATGALNHPNILAIYDVGTKDGAPYVVSELLEGDSLRDRLDHGPLSSRKAIDYATQIARGLAAAHAKGIVHRDLKPDNIFITRDDHVKILDFGLAKLVQPSADEEPQTDIATRRALTDPGTVMGTAGYMAPEQVRGRAVDHRADIFSFGAVLCDLWLLDLSRGTKTRLTFDPRSDGDPLWSSDGKQIVFTSNRGGDGHIHLYQTSASATGDDQLLLSADADDIPTSWSRDGKNILFIRYQGGGQSGVWVLSLADRQAKPLLQSTAFEQAAAMFSPNGRFIAYTSDESGRYEVYVQPFPLSGEKWVISSGGGFLPLWRDDGKELFYLTPEGKIMAVDIKDDGGFEGVVAKPLFQVDIKRAPGFPYAVVADGSRFLINTPADAGRLVPMTVVLNWPATLKQK